MKLCGVNILHNAVLLLAAVQKLNEWKCKL